MKLLYGVCEAKADYLNCYHTYDMKKSIIMDFIYDLYLFYINGNDKAYGIVDCQTNNTLIEPNNIFAVAKEK